MKRHPSSLLRVVTSILLCFSLASTTLAISFDSSFGNEGRLFISFSETGQPTSRAANLFVQPSGRIVVVGSHRQIVGTNFSVSGIGIAGVTPSGGLDTTFGTAGKILLWNASIPQYLRDAYMLPDGGLLLLSQISPTPPVTETRLQRISPGGQVDTSFNASIVGTPDQTSPEVIASGAAGKIYVVVRDYSYQFALFRLKADGSRDETFAPNGVRSLNLNRFNRPAITKLIELENGKLLLVGSYYDTTYQQIAFVLRLDTDTNIDRSFGLLGVSKIVIPGGGVSPSTINILPDGKMLIGGAWVFLGSNTILTRLTPRGRLDYTFGSGAFVMHSYMALNGFGGMAVAPDGKIIAVGGVGDKAPPPQADARLLIAKYSSAGVRESFLLANFINTRDAGLEDLILQSDGKILAAGFTENATDNNTQMVVARFLP